MRRTKTVCIGDLLDDFFSSTPLIAAKIAEARLPEYWEQVVGSPVASYTTNLKLERGVLYIHVQNSVIRHEIFMRRESLKEQLNAKMKQRLVNTIVVK